MTPTIGFHGAAQTVTGSRHLLRIGERLVLIDCGLFQGARQDRDRNWADFPVPPHEIDAVVITHAHTDHIGWLPRLVAQGYQGPIYSTPATLGICRISLPDSGRIQEEEARRSNKHGSRHHPALPLYTEAQAYDALKPFKTVRFGNWHDLPGGAKFLFRPAGHILGSASVEIHLPNGIKLLMGGDLGRYDMPILQDPATVHEADYIVQESTYGDRLHGDEDPMDRLEQVLNDAMRHGSAVIVPSFAIGRTQDLLYYFRKLEDQGRLPRIPIFVDSPMAVSATHLYSQASDDQDEDIRFALRQGDNLLEPSGVQLIRDREQSKALNSQSGPLVIISGSGMANGGRVRHHLMHRLSNPRTTVLFTGFQAAGTLGRQLVDGADEVSIYGEPIQVRASIERITSLSAHADQGEILRWLSGFEKPPKALFLVHGEPEPQAVLRDKIIEQFGWKVEIPAMGQEYDLV